MGETINWEELFGVGANGPELAEPAADDKAQGVKGQEPAEPGIEEGDNLDIPEDSGDNPGDSGDQDAQGETGEPGEAEQEEPPAAQARDLEKDAIAAAARRKAEREKAEALERAEREKQEAVDAAYARMNLKNTYTGEPIKTEAEYLAWQQRFQAEQAEAELKKAGLATLNQPGYHRKGVFCIIMIEGVVDMEYIGNIISAITVILVALIEARAAKERKRMTAANKRNEEYLARRAEENRLSMDLIDAAVSLSVATANAIAEGKINGKMTEAREKAERAQDDYNAFIRETAAQQYAKF